MGSVLGLELQKKLFFGFFKKVFTDMFVCPQVFSRLKSKTITEWENKDAVQL